MLRLTFTEEEVKELHYQRYHHPHPRVQMKMEALLLKAKGVPHHQIASCVGVCENTIRSYLEQYQTGGIEALKQLQFHRPTSELEAHRDTIEASFHEHPGDARCRKEHRSPKQTGTLRNGDLHQCHYPTAWHPRPAWLAITALLASYTPGGVQSAEWVTS